MKTILELPQFEKWVPPRKNAKHPLLKEEERISDILREMKEEGKIGNELYETLCSGLHLKYYGQLLD